MGTIRIEDIVRNRKMQCNYENHLKADMIAMLTEIQLEIEENVLADDPNTLVPFLQAKETCVAIIQQNINALKGE